MTDAYVTLVTSDNYVSGAVTLAHSLRLSGTNKKIVCMITPELSSGSKDYLLDPGHLYDELITVEPFNSFDTANLSLLGRPELGVTLTKIHIWNLLQFRYVVFIDADAMVLRNIDELFERLERADTTVNAEVFAAAPDTGWPDNFNSGLFACKPSAETYSNLKALALSSGSFDGADQGLLNRYFKNWSNTSYGRLSFTFNVTPSAYYSYAPAYAEYMSNIRVVHFIGPEKPWNWNLRFADGKIMPRGFTSHQFKELAMQWWNIRDDFDTFKNNGYKRVEYVPPTPPPEPQWNERHEEYHPPQQEYHHQEYHEEYHPPPQEYHHQEYHQEYHPPPQEYHHQEYHEEYHPPPQEYHPPPPPHEEYHPPPPPVYVPPPPPPEPEPQPVWESWSTWHPTDNAWQDPQPSNDYYNHPVEDFSQSQSYPNFEVVTPPENHDQPREEPFTFVDYPKPPHIHDIMEAYDNKQNEPENVAVYEEEVDDEDMKKIEYNDYSFNPEPVDEFSTYKIGWNFGELSGFKPHRERMTEEEKENDRLFMNLPGIRVNALYSTTRDAPEFPGSNSYKYDPVNGNFTEYGNISEKPTYEVASEYGSENQSFVHEPSSYMSETRESEADLDNYDLYGFSYLPNLRRKKSESNQSITSETPSGHRRLSRRRSIASSISMDFEDFQYNKNTFGINEDDPYNYNGVIDDNFHDDLFEDVDVYDGMYMDQQEPYTDENASYNETDLKSEGYFPEEFDELKKNKVTDTINITQVTNEIALPENKNTVVVSDTYITKHKEEEKPEDEIESSPKDLELPEDEAKPKEATVPASASKTESKKSKKTTKKDSKKKKEEPKVEAEPREATAPVPEPKKEEPVESGPRDLGLPEDEAKPKEATAPTPASKTESKKSKKISKKDSKKKKEEPKVDAEPREAAAPVPVPEQKKEEPKVDAEPREAAAPVPVPEQKKEEPKVEAEPREAAAPVPVPEQKKEEPKVEAEPREAAAPVPVPEQKKEEPKVEAEPREAAAPVPVPEQKKEEPKVEAEPREATAPVPVESKKSTPSKKTSSTTKKVITKKTTSKQPETETIVVEEVEEIIIDPVTGERKVVSRQVKGDVPKDGEYDEVEEVEEIEEIEEIVDPKTGKRTVVSRQVKSGEPKVESKPREAVAPTPASVESKPREAVASTPAKAESKKSTSSKKTTSTTKKVITKKTTSKQPETETIVVEEVEEIVIDPVTGERKVVSRQVKGDVSKDGEYDEVEEVEEIEEIEEIVDPKTGKRTVVSRQVKSGEPKIESKPREAPVVESKPREAVVPTPAPVESKKSTSSKKGSTTTTTTKKTTTKKTTQKQPESETFVVEEVEEIEIDPVTGKQTVVSRQVKGDAPKDGEYDEVEEVEEIEEIEEIVDPKTGKRTVVSRQVKSGEPKIESKPREAVVPTPASVESKKSTSSKKGSTTTTTKKTTTKKTTQKQPESETFVVEEVEEIEIDPVTGEQIVVSRQVKGDAPEDGEFDEVEEIEEIEEVVIDPKTGERTVVSKQVKSGSSTKNDAKTKDASNTIISKEVKEVTPKESEVKKVVTKPATAITASTTKNVVPEESKETSSCTVKVVKKVVRKSPSGRILEVKALPEDNSLSNTKVTRTIVIKNKNGDVVETKTIEGTIDDIENQTSSLIGSTGLSNIGDGSNHVSTKVRRTVIRKNADGEILSTEVKNINDEETLDKMKPMSLLSFNKTK
ncbi:hypothetical protein H8356DRAFT_635744 [Neocallimastix lanati (nom. inval.)]|nr:hypothetical protein H8356DRAFT_635744 [Neocallimastix sp. JGI-2020a]